MKQKTKIALAIASLFFLFVATAITMADKQFEKSGQSIKVGWEFKSEKIQQLEKDLEKKILELTATNKDLIQASVLNHQIQGKADSTIQKKEFIISGLEARLKKKDEKIDSLTTVIDQYRKSGI